MGPRAPGTLGPPVGLGLAAAAWAQRYGESPRRAAPPAPAPGQAAAAALPAAAGSRRGVRGALDSLFGTGGVGPGRRESPEPE